MLYNLPRPCIQIILGTTYGIFFSWLFQTISWLGATYGIDRLSLRISHPPDAKKFTWRYLPESRVKIFLSDGYAIVRCYPKLQFQLNQINYQLDNAKNGVPPLVSYPKQPSVNSFWYLLKIWSVGVGRNVGTKCNLGRLKFAQRQPRLQFMLLLPRSGLAYWRWQTPTPRLRIPNVTW